MWNVILVLLPILFVAVGIIVVYKRKSNRQIHGQEIKKTLNHQDYPEEAKVIAPIQIHLMDSNSINLFPSAVLQCGSKSYFLSENDIENFIDLLREAKEHLKKADI